MHYLQQLPTVLNKQSFHVLDLLPRWNPLLKWHLRDVLLKLRHMQPKQHSDLHFLSSEPDP